MSGSARLGRLLLVAYPRALRRQYGPEILAVLEASCQGHRTRGARVRFWLAAAFDLLTSGARLRMRRSRSLHPATARRRASRPSPPARSVMLWNELLDAVRSLRAAPRFALVTVALLALGLTATTAVFGMVDALLLRPLPYRDEGRLVRVHSTVARYGITYGQLSSPDYLDMRGVDTGLESVALFGTSSVDLALDDHAVRLPGVAVSANFFDVLGVTPLRGRTFRTGEDAPGSNVVVLGENAWRGAFGGDPAIVGRVVHLNGVEHTVIGIVPDVATFPDGRQVWKASLAEAGSEPRSRRVYGAIGRLRHGRDLESAREQIAAFGTQLEAAYPGPNDGIGMTIRDFRESRTGSFAGTLRLLAAGAAFLLLIVCINVTNLGLARATRRSREMAVRAALGAGRGRLVRAMLYEIVLLATLAAAAGLLAGPRLANGLFGAMMRNVPGYLTVQAGALTLAFAAATVVVVTLLAGLLPAMRIGSGDLGAAMKEGDRTGSISAAQRRTLSGLVVLEVGVSCVLLVGAGLALRSFIGLVSIDPGFDPEGVATISLQPHESRYEPPDLVNLFRQIEARLEAMPGVQAVGSAALLPLVGNGNTFVQGDNQTEDEARQNPMVEYSPVTPGYFAAIGIPLLRGRDVQDTDGADAPRVVVVSATTAADLWPGENPLGRRLRYGQGWMTVVGVAGDVHQLSLQEPPGWQMYLPFAQETWEWLAVAVRVEGAPEPWIETMRAVAAEIDPLLAPYNVGTMAEFASLSIAVEKLLALQGWLLAAVATLLAAVGLYGVVSYVSTQRLHEFGIRMALGAGRRDVAVLVLREALTVVGIGLAAGLGASLLLSRWMAGSMYGVSGFEPVVYAGVLLLLAGAATVAAMLPARRAARVQPVEALRDC